MVRVAFLNVQRLYNSNGWFWRAEHVLGHDKTRLVQSPELERLELELIQIQTVPGMGRRWPDDLHPVMVYTL